MRKLRNVIATKLIQPVLKQWLLTHDIVVNNYEFIVTKPMKPANFEDLLATKPHHFVFTSRVAVEQFFKLLRATKLQLHNSCICYSLQGETKTTLQKFGITPLLTATSARQLAQMIRLKGYSESVIFCCSDIRRSELPTYLQQQSITVHELVLYQTVLQPQKIMHHYDAVLFFSPSAVESFFELNQLINTQICCCVGNTTAQALRQMGIANDQILIASKPTQEAVAKLVCEYFEHHQPI